MLTSNVSRCAYYQTESQNTKTRFACEVPYQYLYMVMKKSENFVLETAVHANENKLCLFQINTPKYA